MEDKLNILIAEDEGITALSLEDELQLEGYNVAGIADNGEEAVHIMKTQTVDLALLDIHLKGDWDGIETAQQLKAIKNIPLIYLTAYSDNITLERAKQTAPAAYLIKPYQPRHLMLTIELALHNFAFHKTPADINSLKNETPETAKETLLYFNDAVFIKQAYKFIKINLSDVLYLEAEGNYTHIFTQNKKYTLRYTLVATLEKLHHPHFVRVHRSFAINTYHVENFSDDMLYLGDKEIPLGRNYKEDFFRHFDFL
jgi:DNA-binding LytR/AlgR family response regulator